MKTTHLLPALVLALAAGGLTLAANQRFVQGQQKQEFRFELRDDGSGQPRMFRNGKEVKPGENGFGDLGRLFGQGEGEDGPANPFGGGGAGPGGMMEEMMKQLRERMGQGGPGARQFRIGPGGAEEQQIESRYSKHHRSALAEWRSVVQPARKATMRVLNKDGKQIALATLVGPNGEAVTKASELGDAKDPAIECEFHDGRIVKAKVVDRLAAYDLALIKLEAADVPPVAFRSGDLNPGVMIAVTGTDEDPMAVGVVSSQARNFDDRSKGYLGVLMDIKNQSGEGVGIQEVTEGGAASRAGMKNGDVVLSVNGDAMKFPEQLRQRIASLKPDEQVKLKVKRGEETLELTLSLGRRSDARDPSTGQKLGDRRDFDPTAQMGTALSKNATGYPNAVQCDVTVNADEIGGPAVDVDGNVVGITIARAERTSTLIIPASVLSQLTSSLATGKLQLARDADTLKTDLRDQESKIKELQEALKKAEEERHAAASELEKMEKK